MERAIKIQFWILLLGTIFAWGNFVIELINWINERECSTGCAVGISNPFITPCFYGAVFFLIAFILNIIVIKKMK